MSTSAWANTITSRPHFRQGRRSPGSSRNDSLVVHPRKGPTQCTKLLVESLSYYAHVVGRTNFILIRSCPKSVPTVRATTLAPRHAMKGRRLIFRVAQGSHRPWKIRGIDVRSDGKSLIRLSTTILPQGRPQLFREKNMYLHHPDQQFDAEHAVKITLRAVQYPCNLRHRVRGIFLLRSIFGPES